MAKRKPKPLTKRQLQALAKDFIKAQAAAWLAYVKVRDDPVAGPAAYQKYLEVYDMYQRPRPHLYSSTGQST